MQNWQQRLKGDRTMARSFSIMDIMSDASKAETVTETVEKISIWDIQPNQDNFYQLCNIEQLKSSIYAMGGVQQNIVVTNLPAGEKFKYKLLAGHRRTLACVELVQEGHKEFELIPAVIKNHATSDEEEMLLLMTNSTQRELSDYEKVIQHMKLKKLIPKLKRRDNIPGKVRSLEAEFMNVSQSQIGIYNTIGTRLEADLMELFAKDEIGISLAYEIAKLSSVDQIKLIDVYLQNGRLTDEDVKYLVNNKPIAGQTKLDDIVTEKVSDSDTLEQTAAEEKVPDSDTFEQTAAEEKVLDSDTLEQTAAEEKVLETSTFKTHHTTEKLAAYCTTNTDDIVTALDFIFQMNANEDIFEELLEVFRSKEVNPEIVAKMVFKKILPYEDDCIRVFVNGGYQIEYKHTLEAHIIPYYPFWKGFKDYFHNQIKDIQNVPETSTFEKEEDVQRTDTVEPEEKVLETSTFENSNMAAEQLYSIEDVKKELNTYKQWYEQSKREGVVKFTIKEKMLYDALTLLLDSIKRGNQDENYGL